MNNKSYIGFDPKTGKITDVISGPAMAGPLPPGVMEGRADPNLHMIDLATMTVVPNPDAPTPLVICPNGIAYAPDDYRAQRVLNYPPLQDFVDAYYWSQNGDPSQMQNYLARVTAVKNQHPKPSK